MKEQTCCFTGHRKISQNMIEPLSNQLYIEIEKLILSGVVYFRNGGALGFDTLAALTVVGLKKKYPHIRLIMVLPCKNQMRGWSKQDIATYEYILNSADKVTYTSLHYYNGCMLSRNRSLVDESAYCIGYLTSQIGGTAYTVNYATANGLQMILLS